MIVLLAEDESDLAEMIIEYLADEQIECDYARDGRMAMLLLEQNTYDVLILDVMMPRLNGHEVCLAAKRHYPQMPILFLTAQDSLDDKLTGFAKGADDYLAKPFEFPELAARIKALANRYRPTPAIFQLEDLYVDLEQRIVKRDGHLIHLSSILWELLIRLIRQSPGVVSRSELQTAVWGDQETTDAMLKTQLYRLRQQINLENLPPLIHTIKGVGVTLRKNDDGKPDEG
ncbi:response regulator transcription factor [Hahella ganghwensis]|uniref:response regulator transcription factor n=1 Tax=Hahella ganghwensis TaxID=286420 RepID=UPI0003622919|nr:response regulator transcription factor [Hahella ganghwensis]